MESIISALIAGGLALIGVIITNLANGRQIEARLQVAQAVTDTKIDNLTAEVKKHNNVVDKIPVLENRMQTVEREIKELKEHERNEVIK